MIGSGSIKSRRVFFRFTSLLLCVSVAFLISGGLTAFADENQEKRVKDQNWSESINDSQAHVCVEVWNALKSHGLSDAGTAGVLGNLWQESKFIVNASENIDGSGGYGLMQWTPASRKQELKDMAESMGGKVSDLDVQVALIVKDLNNPSYYFGTGYEKKDIFEATDVNKAVDAFCWVLERPGIPVMTIRYNGGNCAYNALKGSACAVTGGNGVTGVIETSDGVLSSTSEQTVYSRADSPFKDGRPLTYEEQNNVDRISAELSNERNSAQWQFVYVAIAFLGILLIVYSISLLIAFYIDIFNVFTDFSLLGLLTFNSLAGVSSEAEKKGLNKESGSSVRAVSHKDIWLIFGLGIIFSTLLMNGQAFFGMIIRMFNWVISLFTGG